MKIFKKSLRAFFRDMPAMVYVMAFVYLGATLFVALLIQGMVQGVRDYGVGLQTILKDEAVSIQVTAGDLTQLFGQDDVVEAYRQALEKIAASFQNRGPEVVSAIQNLIASSVQTMLIYLGFGFALVAIGFFVGSFLCARQIKIRHGIKRGVGRAILGWFLQSVVFAALLSFSTYLVGLLPWLAAISGLLTALLQTFFSLLKASILQRGFKKAFQGLGAKDIFGFIAISIVLYLVGFSLAALLMYVVSSAVLGAIIVLPLLIYMKDFLDAYAAIYIVEKHEANVTAK